MHCINQSTQFPLCFPIHIQIKPLHASSQAVPSFSINCHTAQIRIGRPIQTGASAHPWHMLPHSTPPNVKPTQPPQHTQRQRKCLSLPPASPHPLPVSITLTTQHSTALPPPLHCVAKAPPFLASYPHSTPNLVLQCCRLVACLDTGLAARWSLRKWIRWKPFLEAEHCE